MPDLVNIPAAKDKNLELLHKPGGGYHYRAILLSDIGYLVESLTGRDRVSYMSMGQVNNPTKETLENLNDLLSAPPAKPDALDLQIEWCARLLSRVEGDPGAEDDGLVPWEPSELVRERAALGLGAIGRWMSLPTLRRPPTVEAALRTSAEAPGRLRKALAEEAEGQRLLEEFDATEPGTDEQNAAAKAVRDFHDEWKVQQVGKAISALVRSMTLARTRALQEEWVHTEEGLDEVGVAGACAAAAQLPLGLDGAWRLFSVIPGLLEIAADSEAREALSQLRDHLRILLIECGIDAAISDPSALVKAAGLRSMVGVMGPNGLAEILSQPLDGWDEIVILSVVDLVAQVGLPSERLTGDARARCLSSLLLLAYDHQSPRVRVRAMIGLQRAVPSGPRSLREEDWFDWEMEARSAPVNSS